MLVTKVVLVGAGLRPVDPLRSDVPGFRLLFGAGCGVVSCTPFGPASRFDGIVDAGDAGRSAVDDV